MTSPGQDFNLMEKFAHISEDQVHELTVSLSKRLDIMEPHIREICVFKEAHLDP